MFILCIGLFFYCFPPTFHFVNKICSFLLPTSKLVVADKYVTYRTIGRYSGIRKMTSGNTGILFHQEKHGTQRI